MQRYNEATQTASEPPVIARAFPPALHIAVRHSLQQKENARHDGLQQLKRRLVELGNSGGREGFELARQLFQDIPALKEA